MRGAANRSTAAVDEEDLEFRARHRDVVREEKYDVVCQVPAVLALSVASEGCVVARGGAPRYDSSWCTAVRHSVVASQRCRRRGGGGDGAVVFLLEPLLQAVHGEVQAEGAEQH